MHACMHACAPHPLSLPPDDDSTDLKWYPGVFWPVALLAKREVITWCYHPHRPLQLLVGWKILLKVVEIGEIGLGVRSFLGFHE